MGVSPALYNILKITDNIIGFKPRKEDLKWICQQIAKPKPALNAVLKTVFTTPKTTPARQAVFRLVTAQPAPAVKPVAIPLRQDSNTKAISDSI